MPLRLLLDENISQSVAAEVRRNRPAVVIESVHTWKNGYYRGHVDSELLSSAATEELTLVTYDLRTIPSLLVELAARGQSHAGVVLIDNLTISNRNFGLLVRSLIGFWDRFGSLRWADRVAYLDKSQT